MNSTKINQPLIVTKKVASVDAYYGPYPTIEDALFAIPIEHRAIGRTVAIKNDNGVIEYQFKNGIENEDLVIKIEASEQSAVTWDSIANKPITFTPAVHSHIWGDISNKPATFAPTIGTTAVTAKAGNYVPTWAEITSKPTTFAPIIGTTASTALAGNTPLLALGTTATTAKAGNYTPTATEIVAAINAMTPEQVTAVQTKLGITPTP